MSSISIEGFQVSPQQERIWKASRSGGHFVAACTMLMQGKLCASALRKAMEGIVRSNSILRTAFHEIAGMDAPLQVIAETNSIEWSEQDLTALSGIAQQQQLDRILVVERDRKFAAEPWIPLRAMLLALSPESNLLSLVLPSLCADTLTLDSLYHRIAAAYLVEIDGIEPASEPIQYLQVSEWLNGTLHSEEAARNWPERSKLALPGETRTPQVGEFSSRMLSVPVNHEIVAGVQTLAEAPAANEKAVWLALWQILLHRLTHEKEIVAGVNCDGRRYEELQDVLGPCSRYVPLKTELDSAAHLTQVVAQVAEALTDAEGMQEFYDCNSESSHNSNGFSAAFDFLAWPGPQACAGVVFSLHSRYACGEPFQLKAAIIRNNGSATLELHWNAAAFDREFAASIARSLLTLAESAIRHPAERVGSLQILNAEDRRKLIVEWNQTAAAFPREQPVHEAISERAAACPGAFAIYSAGESISFAELDQRSNRLARYLRAHGVGPEKTVAILMDRSPELIVALLAVLKAGGAYIPLALSDPKDRLAFILQDAAVQTMIVSRSQDNFAPATSIIDLHRDAGRIASAESTPLPPLATPENLAYVIYTSGSTGTPKGVLVHHAGLTNYLAWAVRQYDIANGGGAPLHSAISFDLSVTTLFAPLLAGKPIHILPESAGPESVAGLMSEKGNFSFVKLTPSHLNIVNEHLKAADFASSTRVLIIGGEALLAETLVSWRASAPRVRLINEYGPTETVVGCCVYEAPREGSVTGPIPIGRPIANTELYILDERGEPVPLGVSGELFIGGIGVARGYHNRAALTAEKFIPDQFSGRSGDRLYRTGDLARYRVDGVMEYLGRIDSQVKLQGHRVELGEIESVLRSHPAVIDAACALWEGKSNEKRLAAFVTVVAKPGPSSNELRQFLAGRLPDYMIPARFVVLDRMPLAASGKVDRKALPHPDQLKLDRDVPYAPPRNLSEELLAAIWSEVLDLDQVGIDDNFFALGGDSIRAIQVRAHSQKRGINFSHNQLFERQTIRALAQAIESGQQPARTGIAPFALLSPEDRQKLPEGLDDAYPLTRLQAGMLYHSELDPETAVYHDLHSFHLKIPFDAAKLGDAIQYLAANHEVLRTSFDINRYAEPLQLVHSLATIPFNVEDLRHLPEDERENAIAEALESEKQNRFSPEEWPLIRFRLLRRTGESFQFIMCFHHAILDGWSAATLLTSLLNRYSALLRAETPRTESLTVAFRDYVSAELSALSSDEQRRYWNRILEDFPESHLPRLPLKRGETAPRAARLHRVTIDDSVAEGLRKVTRLASVPLKSVLLAAHVRVLRLLTGNEEVSTGVVTNARLSETDGDRALGLFLNMLPLRLRLSAGSWQQLAGDVFEAERQALPFRRFPLAELQRLHGGELFETAFNFIHYHVYKNVERVSDAELLDYTGFEQTNFALIAHFSVSPASSRIELHFNYLASEFSESQIAQFGRSYLKALEAIATNPDQAQANASLLDPEERNQLLYQGKPFNANAPSTESIPQRFSRQASIAPNRTALVEEERSWSYQELECESNALARVLRAHGVRSEEIVALASDRTAGMVLAILAILKAGAAYLPLDLQYPAERLKYMLDDAAPRLLLVTSDEVHQKLQQSGALPAALDVISITAARENADEFSISIAPDTLAYVIYTSGSTGTPKGVMVTHANVLRLLDQTDSWFRFHQDDVWTLFHSYAFDFSVWELWGALLYGGRLELVPYWVSRQPEEFYRFLETRGVTVLNQTPSAFRQLMEVDARQRSNQLSLRYVIFGGEALQPGSLRPWAAGHTERQPSLINMYGITETTVHVTHRPITAADIEGDAGSVIGEPIPDLQLYILDSGMEPAPIGVPGELYVGGAGLARGYLNRPGLTAERFVSDPFGEVPGGRLYRTGDLARRLPDGDIEYLGRADQQVKIRGFRIELGEIEAAIRKHPGVQEAVVIASEATGERRLLAYVVPANGAAVAAADVLERLRLSLPVYMVPAACLLLDRLPLTTNGKLDRRKLPAPADEHLRQQDYVAPRTETEKRLAQIWAELLKLDRIGVGDNFFHLGGHSLLATQVVSRVRAQIGREIPLRDLFEYPALESFASRVDQLRAGTQQPLTTLRRGLRKNPSSSSNDIASILAELEVLSDQEANIRTRQLEAQAASFPLSYSQEQVWKAERKHPGALTLPLALRLKGPLNIAALERSLTEIVRRHEAFRTVIVSVDGQPHQSPRKSVADVRLHVANLQAAGVPEFVRCDASEPFDLSRGPLYRISLGRLAEQDHVIVLTMHLLISDGWSVNILLEEIGALYSAFCQELPSPLPDLPAQPIDYALWERDRVESEEFRPEIEYWLRQLADAPVLDLPVGTPRRAHLPLRGGSVNASLTTESARQVRQFCQASDVTPFMLLTAVFEVMLSEISGQRALTVGIPDPGRRHHETECMIGSFADTLVLHGRLAPEQSFAQHLANVRSTMLDAYAHKDVPFAKIASLLRPGGDIDQRPLFSVMIDLVVQTPSRDAQSAGELAIEVLPPDPGSLTVGNDMTLLFTSQGEELRASLLYKKALFEETAATAMLRRFMALLETAITRPGTTLGELAAGQVSAR